MKHFWLLLLALTASLTLSAQNNSGLEGGFGFSFLNSSQANFNNVGMVRSNVGWRFNKNISMGLAVGYIPGLVATEEYQYSYYEYDPRTGYDIETVKTGERKFEHILTGLYYLNLTSPIKDSKISFVCDLAMGFGMELGRDRVSIILQALPGISVSATEHIDLHLCLGYSSISMLENDPNKVYPTFSASLFFH
jgi:hypothetical protein